MRAVDTPPGSPSSPTRRRAAGRLFATVAAAPLAVALAGCGFHPRRAPELRFRTIRLAGFRPRSPLAAELRRAIDATPQARVVDGAAPAELVLESLDDARERVVVGSGAVGQVTELRLRSRFTFRLQTAAGRELIAPTEYLQTRDLSYTESAALAKEQEENFLFRAMQGDIVAQVMRRLASVQPAGGG